MNHQAYRKTIWLLSLALLATGTLQVSAQSSRREIYGDWQVTTQYNEFQMESILSFSWDREGQMTGVWISFRGLTEVIGNKG